MSRTFLVGFAALLVAIAAWVNGRFDTEDAEATKIVKVTADDLESGKVVVIESLGVPLKTMQTVRGTWRYPGGKGPSKDSDLSFHVTHINGETLQKPVTFHRHVVAVKYPLPWDRDDEKKNGPAPSANETWEIRAYETGRFAGKPDDYNKQLGAYLDSEVQAAVWDRPFLLELHGIMQRPVAPGKKSKP